MSFGKNFWIAVKFYWKAIFIIIFPIFLLPIFVVNNNGPNRCIYVIVVMAGFWITEALPIPITSLIPVAFFPLMGILNSPETAACYISEPTILLIAGYMLALAVEASNLQMRISLHIIKLVSEIHITKIIWKQPVFWRNIFLLDKISSTFCSINNSSLFTIVKYFSTYSNTLCIGLQK